MQTIINLDSANIDISYSDFDTLKDKKVLLLSMVNNCSFSYEYIKNFIQNITKNVKRCCFHYITNNNIDGTVFLLENLSKTTSTTGTILQNIKITKANRIPIFTMMRNALFNSSASILGCDFDYVIMFDSDLICNIPHQPVLESLLVDGDWSSISANSTFTSSDHHYDVLALRLLDQELNIRDIYPYFDKYYGVSELWADKYFINDWQQVRSAFGGLTIYKMPELVEIIKSGDCLYDLNSYPEYTCEHITLANKLAGKKLINPNIKYTGSPA